jgi:hypothetical protein
MMVTVPLHGAHYLYMRKSGGMGMESREIAAPSGKRKECGFAMAIGFARRTTSFRRRKV